MIIRQVNRDEIEKIKEVKPNISEEVIKQRLNRQEKGEVEFLMLTVRGEVTSFVLLKWIGKKSHPEYPDMEDLYTKKDKRGKGYATKLIADCERRAREKGFEKIGLAVNPELNTGAKRFYEKLGYQHDGRDKYVDGVYNGKSDWVIDMEKEIC